MVNVDTNGSSPTMLRRLINEGLVDYIAMDVKAPLKRYRETVRAEVNIDNIEESIELIKAGGIDYEFRITAVPGLTNEEDLMEIAQMLESSKRFVIQQFIPERTLDETFKGITPYPLERLDEFRQRMTPFFRECKLRY
ncbi:MAG: radical SAM protein [Candidatus Bathyarchaeia archaeon]